MAASARWARTHRSRRVPKSSTSAIRRSCPASSTAHTHVTGESGDDWAASTIASMRRTVPETTMHATVYARRLLEAGFTTIRDLGSGDWIDVGLREADRRGRRGRARHRAGGPRARRARRALRRHRLPRRLLRRRARRAGRHRQRPRGQFRDAVRYQVKYGADVIKVCATGGVLSLGDEVDTPQLTQDPRWTPSSTRRTGCARRSRCTPTARAAPRSRSEPASIRSSTARSSTTRRSRMMKEQGT